MSPTVEAWPGLLTETQRAVVFALYRAVFEQESSPALEQKWAERMPAGGMTWVAFDGPDAIGFKLGYSPEPGVFYSWLGGVLPGRRGTGIGQLLLDRQHAWCRQQGYHTIRTKTLNRWKAMLLLNLRSGFDITSTYTDSAGTLKIVLEKKI